MRGFRASKKKKITASKNLIYLCLVSNAIMLWSYNSVYLGNKIETARLCKQRRAVYL